MASRRRKPRKRRGSRKRPRLLDLFSARPTKPRKPRRKPRKRRTVIRPEPPKGLKLKRFTVYRKAGRFSKKTIKGAKRETQIWQVDAQTGRKVRWIEATTRTTITKVATKDMIARPGEDKGRIDWALSETNITLQFATAKRIEVLITGKNRRGKEQRIKKVIIPIKHRKVVEYVMGQIVQALHEAGFRGDYTRAHVNWAVTHGRARPSSLKLFSRYKPLIDMEVTVRVEQ